MRIKLVLGVKNISPTLVTLQFALDENKGSVGLLEDQREVKLKVVIFPQQNPQCKFLIFVLYA